MKTLNALCLSLLLCCPAISQPPVPAPAAVRKQVSRLKPGAKIVLLLSSREKFKATLLAVGEESLRVTTKAGGMESERAVRFDEIRDVYKQTPPWVWIATYAGVAAALGIGYVLATHPGN